MHRNFYNANKISRNVIITTFSSATMIFPKRHSVSPVDLFSSPGGLMALFYGRGKGSQALSGENDQGARRTGRKKRYVRSRTTGDNESSASNQGWRRFLASEVVILAMVIFVLSALWELIKSQKSVYYEKLKSAFMVTLEVRSSQKEFAMIMDWMARQPEGVRLRNLSLKPVSLQDENKAETVFNASMLQKGEDENGNMEENRATFVPGYGVHFFTFHGTRMWVRRELDASKQRFAANNIDRENDILTITFLSRDRDLLNDFLKEVRISWRTHVKNKVQIYHAIHSEWRLLTEKTRRPLETLYLPKEVTALVFEAKLFFGLKSLYHDLGIPWRRGFLFEGPPGTGKSSFIHALAGELQLPVHVLSLQNSWIDDSTLLRSVSQLPSRCILLIEDIENAIIRPPSGDKGESASAIGGSRTAGVSMSALLNALDGIATSQGRLLVLTTNDSSKIPYPEALLRPGRIDRRVHFGDLSAVDFNAMGEKFSQVLNEYSKKESSELKNACDVDKILQQMESFEHVPAEASPAIYQQQLLNAIYDNRRSPS